MPLESDMVDAASVMQAGLTDKGMLIELKMVYESFVIKEGFTDKGMSLE